MENRILGVTEIYDRLKPLFVSYPIKFLAISPDYKLEKITVPSVIILEGTDEIIKRANRNYLGYPAYRQLEVIVECWESTLDGVRSLYQAARNVVLASEGILLTKEIIVREAKAVGPFNLDIPGVKGMRIIFLMDYQDEGLT